MGNKQKMNRKGIMAIVLSVSILLVSCGTYKAQKQESLLNMPQLGSIVKARGGLLYKASEQIGMPKLTEPLKLHVQELPFNDQSYGAYSDYILSSGKVNSIAYTDSLRYRPKYLRLQLRDRIALKELLNSDLNSGIRSYLEKEADHALVVSLDVTLSDNGIDELSGTEHVFLQPDAYGILHLLLVNGPHKKQMAFSEVQVFDYRTVSFCWGEDRYHNKQVENLVSDTKKCPKGTHRNAAKVSADKSYLKF
ncbi:MAG: hypothetical protein AAFZ89_01730 [Bacteroidota bacterium]